jgi:hypothetical protein
MGIRKRLFSFLPAPERVYVLGAGPAGLLAAQAASEQGYEVVIFSAPGNDGTPKKSDLFGCQYLHAAIPGLTGSAGRAVRYLLNGTPEGYREKVYGSTWDGNVSPDEYGPEQNHFAWDLRKVYDELWHRWSDYIVPALIGAASAATYANDHDAYTISTIPAPNLCKVPDQHKFHSQNVWAMGSLAADEPVPTLPYCAPAMTVECDGTRDRGWYRAATVFGYSTLEWPGGQKPPIAGVARVSKPLSTDCDCWAGPRWLRVGRYGEWKKSVLVHTAYEQTTEWLA